MGRRERWHRWARVAAFVVAVLATVATSPAPEPSRTSEALSGVVRLTVDQPSALVRFVVEVPDAAPGRLTGHEVQLTFPPAPAGEDGEAFVGLEPSAGAADAGPAAQDAVLVGGAHPASEAVLQGERTCGAGACSLETVARFTLVGSRPTSVGWTATAVLRLEDDDDVPAGLVLRADGPTPVPPDFHTTAGTWRSVGPAPPVTVAQVDLQLGPGGTLIGVTPDGAAGEVLLVGPPPVPVPATQRGSRPAAAPDRDGLPYPDSWSGRRMSVVAAAEPGGCTPGATCRRSGFIVVRPQRGHDAAAWWRLDLRTPAGAAAGGVDVRPLEPVELSGRMRLTQDAPTSRQVLAVDGRLSGSTLVGFLSARLAGARSTDGLRVGGITAVLGTPPSDAGQENLRGRQYVEDRTSLEQARFGPTRVLALCGGCEQVPLTLDWVNPGRSGAVEVDWRVLVAAVPADGPPRPFTLTLR